jgi:hypothetical protein
MTDCVIARLEKAAVTRALHEDLGFSEFFVSYLLSRNVRLSEDLIDHLFNSSERRLARVLLLLANYEKNRQDVLVPNINQQTLAKMIGTTRSRVNYFMNKFRRLGFIEYNGQIKVHHPSDSRRWPLPEIIECGCSILNCTKLAGMAIFFLSMRQPSLSTDAMVGMSFALRKTEAHWRLIACPELRGCRLRSSG